MKQQPEGREHPFIKSGLYGKKVTNGKVFIGSVAYDVPKQLNDNCIFVRVSGSDVFLVGLDGQIAEKLNRSADGAMRAAL